MPAQPPSPLTRRRMLQTAAAGLALPLVPLGLPAARAAAGKTGPTSLVYVEVNDNALANAGKYTLASSGAPVFDIAVIFAGNINYDGTKAYVHLNSQVQATLDAAATQIRPLQQRGTKVLLSILGNHQGAGVCNFPSREAAAAFAREVADVVRTYGLDGVDIDDEYAGYGANGTGQPNDFSFVYFIEALRAELPDAFLHLYYYGPVTTRTVYDGVQAGTFLSGSGNAIYGTYVVPQVPGLSAAQLSPAAVKLSETPAGTAASFAQRTVREGYGMFLTYDLRGGDQSRYVSTFTKRLYGERAVYTP